ncbi:MAG TPA: DUF72 domain-containing protein [Candidatus Limnocylindrales bacterium]|jgi:uncharacterized protein YecE (DUF72 family)|nr:DUF72 domain-containing protein [Candidatus Limnocylindrales bacterium]
MTVRIGTSGFSYEHWRGRYYPPGSRGREFAFYASMFETVELNVTFYRMPAAATFRTWARQAPDGFTFAVKASRYLTHVKRLVEPRDAVAFLVERAQLLGPHLGPILLQLPPDMPIAIDRLAETLDAFPQGIRVAVEPRHDSWFVEPVRELLTARGAALCWADRRGPITPTWRTADWGYLRFHQGRASPRPCYGERALASWATRLCDAWGPGADGYAYFNNDHRGCALRDAATFARLVGAAGLDPVRALPITDAVVAS